jgi:hypothetical protein
VLCALLLIVFAVSLVLVSHVGVSEDGSSDVLSAIAAVLSGVLLLVACVVWALNGAQVLDDMARISELRRVVATADPSSAHDIYGQASETNQQIAAQHVWRRVWWTRDLTPAQWDTVPPIDLTRFVPNATRHGAN